MSKTASLETQQTKPRGVGCTALVRRFAERMDCMNGAANELYALWLADKSKPRLDFPEWIIQRDNPGMMIPGLSWGTLWAGWERVSRPGDLPDLYLASDWQPNAPAMPTASDGRPLT